MMYNELMDSATNYENNCDWFSAINVYNQLYNQRPTLHVISKLAWCYSRNSDFESAKIECFKLIVNRNRKIQNGCICAAINFIWRKIGIKL